jgi:hypothetical protein
MAHLVSLASCSVQTFMSRSVTRPSTLALTSPMLTAGASGFLRPNIRFMLAIAGDLLLVSFSLFFFVSYSSNSE